MYSPHLQRKPNPHVGRKENMPDTDFRKNCPFWERTTHLITAVSTARLSDHIRTASAVSWIFPVDLMRFPKLYLVNVQGNMHQKRTSVFRFFHARLSSYFGTFGFKSGTVSMPQSQSVPSVCSGLACPSFIIMIAKFIQFPPKNTSISASNFLSPLWSTTFRL